MSKVRTKWTYEERQSVAKMLRSGLTASEIADAIGRTTDSVTGKVRDDEMLRAIGFARTATSRQDFIESRRPIYAPRDTRSLTAMVFGDPLPGRSALDRRPQHDQHG